jgi:5-methylcytosine-specific restriction protein A
MATRNPSWQRDELILALDLYFRYKPSTISQTHPEVVSLSKLLNALPVHTDRPDRERYRNPSGVYMKLCNFLALDPSYHGKGLERGGRLEQAIWNEFAGDKERLAVVSAAIKEGYRMPPASLGAVADDEEEEFPEGRILYRLHRARERSAALVRQAKIRALKRDGRVSCVACGFDFGKSYGKLGEGYIECHHARPLSSLMAERRSRVEDVVLVCSNCHRMIHRRRPWLAVSEVRRLLGG